jgi:hypothetical protein
MHEGTTKSQNGATIIVSENSQTLCSKAGKNAPYNDKKVEKVSKTY